LALSFFNFRRTKNIPNPVALRAAKPPTIPPTIAPILELPEFSEGSGSLVKMYAVDVVVAVTVLSAGF
jgi:hypothetical protein